MPVVPPGHDPIRFGGVLEGLGIIDGIIIHTGIRGIVAEPFERHLPVTVHLVNTG